MDLKIFYAVCFAISLITFLWHVYIEEKNSSRSMILMAIIAVSNGGYFALAVSENLYEAILANKLTYVSGCYVPMLGCLVTCELCNVKISRAVTTIMYTFQTLVFAFVCSIGYTNWYYTTVNYNFSEKNGVAYLTKTYGFAHMLYPMSMYLYFFIAVGILIYSLRKKNVVSYKAVSVLLLCYSILLCTYVMERAFSLEVELMPFVYTVSFVGIVFICKRKDSYSVTGNILKIMDQRVDYAYISVDKKLRYMGCNEKATVIFPDIKDVSVEKKITEIDECTFIKVVKALEKYIESKEQSDDIVVTGNEFYDIKVEEIRGVTSYLQGYMVELKDVTESQNYIQLMEDYNRNLESEVDGKTHRIREMQDRILMGMAQMVESRDKSTGGHIKRTSDVVKVFSKRLLKENIGLSEEYLYYVQKSAPMHDLGKIAVKDNVLQKKGRFEPWEYEIMKTHSAAGAGIVDDILTGVESEEFIKIAVNVAHYHHEKVNGTGYPEGLKGDDIPFEARIMALADVFDALVSKRCYKEAFSYDKAFSIIEESLGSHFDEKLGRIFMKCRAELEALYNDYAEEEMKAAEN